MKAIIARIQTRKPLSYRATQCLYGVSILLTFLAAGRFAVAP